MLASPILEAALPIAVLITIVAGLWLWRRKVSGSPGRAVASVSVSVVAKPEVASRIVVGASADQPALEIGLMLDEDAFNRGALAPGSERLGLVSRMSACLQAAPSLLVEQAHQGRQLMEVVINNPLVKAPIGAHFLPFARGADGKILDQAKLLNPEGLSSLVNAAAVWQLASMVVAQKHLADISAKLDEITQEIMDLKDLFQDRLDGDIEGTYRYLRSVAKCFQMGEVPKFARVELESCRRELLQVESSLVRMFARRVAQDIDHKEAVGTGDLFQETMKRYDELDKIAKSLMTCFKAQALAWYVLSLFPDEETSAQVWKAEIVESMKSFYGFQIDIQKTASADASKFQSWLNFESTLQERRNAVLKRAKDAAEKIKQSAACCEAGMTETALLLEHNNDPIRFGLEIVNSEIVEVRVLA